MNVSETLASQGRRQMDQSHFIDNRLSHTALSVTKNEKSITLISTFVTIPYWRLILVKNMNFVCI